MIEPAGCRKGGGKIHEPLNRIRLQTDDRFKFTDGCIDLLLRKPHVTQIVMSFRVRRIDPNRFLVLTRGLGESPPHSQCRPDVVVSSGRIRLRHECTPEMVHGAIRSIQLEIEHRDRLKPEAVEEIEAGSRVTGTALADAMTHHSALLERMRRFEERYEFLVCAVNQVPPFDTTIDWPRHIDGVEMEHYVAWMKSAYWISVTFRPAISVPAGFTSEGLPVGIQIVGRYRDDSGVLQLAHAFEQATGFGRVRPGQP